MKAIFINIIFGVWLLALPGFAAATDQEDATRAAQEILRSLQQGEYENLWNTQTSKFFRSKITKDSFIANLAMSRQQLGSPGESRLIDISYSQTDPSTVFKGEIYAFNYLNSYSNGKFYERIVVVKETDGKFRLSGLWGTPAPK